MGRGPSTKLARSSRLPKGRQQVAAICYRIRKRGIEFLLVQTRGGRWIFPKGGVEPGLTHAQSAALEAFEEAGVHGRMEKTPFARYLRRKTDTAIAAKDTGTVAARSSEPELAVAAHLCEVSRLERPQESGRNPTWFSAENAKQRLLADRAPEFGAELARVVDRAAVRIRRLHGDFSTGLNHARMNHAAAIQTKKDGLQEVRFEAFESAQLHRVLSSASYARYVRREDPDLQASAGQSAPPELPIDVRLHKLLRGSSRPILRLGSGTGSSRDPRQNVQFIDGGHPTDRAKAAAKSAKNHRE
jgi:8-oxo-dGTP pyrophosphatase MutT (NUDIX family)